MTEDKATLIERRLAALETRNAVEEVHRINVEARLDGIEDTLKWLVRLVLGGLVMAIMGYVIAGGIGPMQ